MFARGMLLAAADGVIFAAWLGAAPWLVWSSGGQALSRGQQVALRGGVPGCDPQSGGMCGSDPAGVNGSCSQNEGTCDNDSNACPGLGIGAGCAEGAIVGANPDQCQPLADPNNPGPGCANVTPPPTTKCYDSYPVCTCDDNNKCSGDPVPQNTGTCVEASFN